MQVDFAAVFAVLPTPCLLLTADLVICDVNDAYLAATRRRRDELLGRMVFEVFPDNPDDPAADGVRNLRASLERARRTGRPDAMGVQKYDISVPSGDGAVFEERFWAPVNTPVLDGAGATVLIVHRAEDVTDAHRARTALERSERRFRSLVEHASDPILVVGDRGRYDFVSPAVEQVLGRTRDELDRMRWGDAAHPDHRVAARELLARARGVAPGQTVSGRLHLVHGDGSRRVVDVRATNHRDDPAIRGVVMNVRDVTEQHEVERTLQRQAWEDELTGMPNRRWFLQAARQAVARAARTGDRVGVVLLDVDDFKLVNDTMGHPAGDRLLVELARRMRAALRPNDTVARLGGDEFAILAEDLGDASDALRIARRVAGAATGRYRLGPAFEARVTFSVGLSTEADADADTLLAHADAALYEAKRAGRDRVEVFDPELRRELLRRVRVEQELHRALEGDELVLHWQPIVRTRDGAVTGAEALVRWQHPERGLLAAAEFLPVAEAAGLMPRIGGWVVSRALEQAAIWQGTPHPPQVFVNLAAEQLRGSSLPEEVARLTAEHRLDAGRVCFEVSERVLDEDLAAIREQLVVLRGHGFGLALDDFGAGNTALSWLQDLPLDVLKLDRRFAATLGDATAQAITGAVVQLAPSLGVTTLAEGVETADQLATLRRLGCDHAQGYEIAMPQPASAVTAALSSSP